MDMYIQLYLKWINQQGATVWHMEFCSMYVARRGVWGENNTWMRMAKSFCCPPETTTTLLIIYVVVQSLLGPTLWDPMDCSKPVLHDLRESAQIPVHWIMMPPNHLIFSSCPWSFLASGSFLTSLLFASGGHSTGASAWVLPKNIQGRFSLGLTGYTRIQNQKLKNNKAWQPRASRTEGQRTRGQNPTVESSGSNQPPQ